MTTLILPDSIAACFAADQRSADAIAHCFATQAVVKDEGRTYTGLDAIKAWKAAASAAYTYTSEPFCLAACRTWKISDHHSTIERLHDFRKSFEGRQMPLRSVCRATNP